MDGMDGTGRTNIIDIRRLESLVQARRHRAAVAELLHVLSALEQGGGSTSDRSVLPSYTRLASAAATLLADAELTLTAPEFTSLCLLKRAFTGLFRVSGFGSTEHVLRLLEDSGKKAPRAARARLLAALTLDNTPLPDFERLFRERHGAALHAWLGLLTTKIVTTQATQANRNRLLALGPLAAQGALTDDLLRMARSVWMLCSYADVPDKHAVKAHLNTLFRGWIAARGVRPPALRARRPLHEAERPVLLVPLEMFDSRHAMYRCYAHGMEQLRKDFHLVALAGKNALDTAARALFDEMHEVPERADRLPEISALVERIAPDMIFYPSLGMRLWTVLLANLRLAPIQAAGLGHPATTRSEHIDYMILGSEASGDGSAFSERCLVLRGAGFPWSPHAELAPVAHTIREKPEVLRIAVTAKSMKLSPAFIACCARLAEGAGRPVAFEFFPNEAGCPVYELRRSLEGLLPGCTVHPRTDYNAYMARVAACDMGLGSFPFGGSNSTFDVLRCGLPIVVLRGAEPHARTDARTVIPLGLAERMVADSIEEYERLALALIRDDEARCALSREIIDADPERILFHDERAAHPDDLLHAVRWLYEHHENITRNGPRLLLPEDRD